MRILRYITMYIYAVYLFLLSSCKVRSVDDGNILNDPIQICMHCGYGGSVSHELTITSNYYSLKDTANLYNEFYKQNDSYKFLSAYFIDKLRGEGNFTGDSLFLIDLSNYKKTSSLILFSTGCTEHNYMTVRDFFDSTLSESFMRKAELDAFIKK